MLDILLEGVIALGPERQVFYCNDAFQKMFDLSRGRLFTGRPIYESLMFDDKNLFLMPEGSGGEDDVLHYKPVKFETHHGRKGDVQIAIVPTREVFAKNKLWFAYFHQENQVNATLGIYGQVEALMERVRLESIPTKDLLQSLAEIREKISLV